MHTPCRLLTSDVLIPLTPHASLPSKPQSTALVNDSPTVSDRAYSATEDTALVVGADTGLRSGAADGEGDTLTVTSVTSPTVQGGTVTSAANGSFVYTPVLNFHGNDTFNFTIADGNGGSAVAQARITVGESNTVGCVGAAALVSSA